MPEPTALAVDEQGRLQVARVSVSSYARTRFGFTELYIFTTIVVFGRYLMGILGLRMVSLIETLLLQS
jgi:hypothetical protein